MKGIGCSVLQTWNHEILKEDINVKKYIVKGLACALALALMTPMVFQYTTPAVAKAAKNERQIQVKKEKTEKKNKKEEKKDYSEKQKKKAQKPYFAVAKKTLNGIGATYQMEVKNLSATTARTWYSTNEKVATVDKNGLVKSVNYGTAVIKCTINDKKKGRSVLSCVIKVKGNKAEVTITNKMIKDEVQSMTVASTYDFNAVIKPEGTEGKITWSVSDPTVATVNEDGIVTAVKEGITVLTASAVSEGISVTNDSATLQEVKSDKVVIKVVSGEAIEAAHVQDVTLVDDKTLSIKFSTSMKADTLFNSLTSVLENSVTIVPVANASGLSAVNPGELKGVLTEDGKILTVLATNSFYGYYDVKLSSQVTAISGALLQEYIKRTLLIYIQ
ncbi:MAG: hypothetical protein K0R00_3306 [Herbinix sp.]|jgi:hypothetical protein|nr:hypothetical protein [Herbinix sp.]